MLYIIAIAIILQDINVSSQYFYTLNLHNTVCQIYFNKIFKNKVMNETRKMIYEQNENIKL